MSELPHPQRAPDLPRLLERLAARQIRYIVTGSVAALLYNLDLQPGDLDITPALDRVNLSQLIELLREIEAAPANGAGRWQLQPDGERVWVAARDPRDTPSVWAPDPGDSASLDHLFSTRYGNFDVVPEVAGSFSWLKERAVAMTAYGQQIWVAHIDDLLSTITVPRRAKDAPRVRALREIQHRRGMG